MQVCAQLAMVEHFQSQTYFGFIKTSPKMSSFNLFLPTCLVYLLPADTTNSFIVRTNSNIDLTQATLQFKKWYYSPKSVVKLGSQLGSSELMYLVRQKFDKILRFVGVFSRRLFRDECKIFLCWS